MSKIEKFASYFAGGIENTARPAAPRSILCGETDQILPAKPPQKPATPFLKNADATNENCV
jgi:alpha-beta hydrolase superfamily lysophospholipase